MPADTPRPLVPDEVYALCAYALFLNGIVPEDTILDASSLPQVVMPNHAGFTGPDPRLTDRKIVNSSEVQVMAPHYVAAIPCFS